MFANAQRRREAINRLAGWCKAQAPKGFHIAGEQARPFCRDSA